MIDESVKRDQRTRATYKTPADYPVDSKSKLGKPWLRKRPWYTVASVLSGERRKQLFLLAADTGYAVRFARDAIFHG